SSHRFLLSASALLGAAFMVLTDALARTVAAPVELPVGVLTAFVGVPFFVWVLKRGDKRPAAAGTGAGSRAGTAVHAPRPDEAAAAGAAGGSRPGAAAGAPDAVDSRPAGLPPPAQARELTFRYPDAPSAAVTDVSLDVPAG